MNRRKHKEVSVKLFKKIEPILPVIQPSPKGGRPRVSDEMALNGIVFVMRTGIPWEELPQELGFGSGMTCWRRMRQWQIDGVWPEVHRLLLAEMRGANAINFSRVRRRPGQLMPAPAPAAAAGSASEPAPSQPQA